MSEHWVAVLPEVVGSPELSLDWQPDFASTSQNSNLYSNQLSRDYVFPTTPI